MGGAARHAGSRDRRGLLINDDGGYPVTAGEMRRVRMTEAHDYDLVASIVDAPEADRPRLPQPMFPILPDRSTLESREASNEVSDLP